MNSYIHILVLVVLCGTSNSISCFLTCKSTCINDLTNTAKANAVAINKLEGTLSEKLRNSDKKLSEVLNLVQVLTLASSSGLPRSCAEIKQKMPQSSSGMFLIATSKKKAQYHMETLCDSDGGWTRLALL